MRPNLIDGILNTISYNLNRKNLTNNFFEFGSIYHKIGKKYIQKKVLGIALNGEIISKTWATDSLKTDFFHLKNIIINLFRKFNLPFSEEISENRDLQIKTENKLIASINQVSLSKLNSSGIKSEVYYSHVDLDLFYSLINDKFFDVKPISKYPKVVRDFSFLINDKVLFNDVRDTVLSISPKYINEVNLTDSYNPKNNNGKISYSFSVSISSNEKTMSDKEIKNISEKIISTVSKKHEAVIRDQ